MKKLVIGFIILLSCYIYSQPVTIISQFPKITEVLPGSTIPINLLVVNESEEDSMFFEKLELPDTWDTIPSPLPPFFLEKKKQSVQLFMIYVPETAQGGDYPIRYIVQGSDHPELVQMYDFTIRVRSESKIQIQFLKEKQSFFGGGSYELPVKIVNTGNASEVLKLEVKTRYEARIEVLPAPQVTVPPFSTKDITIKVNSDKKMRGQINDSVTITGTYLNDEKKIVKARADIVILPGENIPAEEKYYQMSMISGLSVGSLNGQTKVFLDNKGLAVLDEKRENNLAVMVRIPLYKDSTNDVGGFWITPESLYAHFWNPTTDLFVGDGNYTVTPLTMSADFGRGASASYIYNHWYAKGLFLSPRDPDEHQQYGALFGYFFDPKKYIKLGFLQTDTKGNDRYNFHKRFLYSLSSKMEFAGSQKILVEASGNEACHKKQWGFYFDAQGKLFNKFSYSLNEIYAGPDYYGYYQDTQQFLASITFPIFPFLNGNIYTYYQNNNLDDNPNSSASPKSYLRVRGGVTYFSPIGLTFNAYYLEEQNNDRFLQQKYKSQTVNIDTNYRIKKWIFLGKVGMGTYHYTSPSLNQSDENWNNIFLAATYVPNNYSSYEVEANLGDVLLDTSPANTQTYGVSGNWQFKHGSLRLFYRQGYEYHTEENKNVFTGHSFLGYYMYTLPNDHKLNMYANVSMHVGQNYRYDAMLTYSIPWKIPLRKRPIKGIHGTVMDHNNNPASGVLVTCDEKSCLTDKKGNYIFKTLREGKHKLNISELPLGLVPTAQFPKEIQFGGSAPSAIDIQLTHGAEISGRLDLLACKEMFIETPDKEIVYWKEKGYENGVIFLENVHSKEKITLLTDRKGAFFYSSLRPGKWILTVSEKVLPKNYVIEQGRYEFTVKAKDKVFFSTSIKPVPKKITMME